MPDGDEDDDDEEEEEYDDDDDDDDDDYDDDHPLTSLAVSKTTKTSGNDNNKKLKRGKQEELQKKKTTNTKSKKDSVISKSKAPPTKSSDKTGDSKNAVIKVESESNDEITTMTTTPATEKLNILDSFDVILPLSIVNSADNSNGGGDQCTLLVEVSDPNDAIALGEFGGSVGAIGRFESDPNGITLDLKGNQYRGSLLPGPTCLVVGFPSHKFGSSKKEQQEPIGKLRVEGIADEYTTLVQIDDHMKKLDAVVTGNNNNNEEVDSD